MKLLKWSATIVMCLFLIYMLWVVACDVGELPDPEYCATRHTQWQMLKVWMGFISIVLIGWFAGHEAASNKYK